MKEKAKAKHGFEVMAVTMVPYARLNPAPYNPRVIDARQIEALKGGIKEHGFLDPLVVQKKNWTIIGGHQRYRAVREIAVETETEVPELPCIVIDIDDRAAKRLNISLNKVSGEFDDDLLGELLQDIQSHSPILEEDVLLMGFDDVTDIASLLGDEEQGGDSEGDDGQRPVPTKKAPSLTLDFETTEQRDGVKALLGAKSQEGELTGATLARLLALKQKAKK